MRATLTLACLGLLGTWLLMRRGSDTTSAVTSPPILTDQVRPSAMHKGASAPARPALAPRPDAFAEAEVLECREAKDPEDDRLSQRQRLVRTTGKYPLVRLAEWIRTDGAAGTELLSQTAMVADHVKVKVADASAEAPLAEFLRATEGEVRRRFPMTGILLVAFPKADLDTVPTMSAALANVSGVKLVEPDYLCSLASTPNDSRFPEQYGLNNTGQTNGLADADIDALEAWNRHTGTAGVVVGVIDTGVDFNHPDLAANIFTNGAEAAGQAGVDDDGNGYIDDLHGWDFYNNDAEPLDDNRHGTHCAGIIGAVGNNGIGVVGVCWEAQIMALKFIDGSGYNAYDSDATEAVTYAARMGAAVTSNSWRIAGYSQMLHDAIYEAGLHDQLFVVAAGNGLPGFNVDSDPVYPAVFGLPNMITVAATNHLDVLASFSCYGAKSVHLGAPGEAILSTLPSGTYGPLSGTSMATPMVAGACALMKSYRPTLHFSDLKRNVLTTLDPLPSLAGKTITGGRLNVGRCLDRLSEILITPAEDPAFVAEPGGIFTPESHTLTLTNLGMQPQQWSALESALWLKLSPIEGTLDPGQSVNITLELDVSTAAGLPVGTHSAPITVRNLTLNTEQQRTVSAIVDRVGDLPFGETFSSAQLAPYWKLSGTNQARTEVRFSRPNDPSSGFLLMDDSTDDNVWSRNELTLTVDLRGYSDVVLRYTVGYFSDEADPSPPVPFVIGADFDGVAVSEDGIYWYDVTNIRLPGSAFGPAIDLDEAVARYGLHYTERFLIRFNHFDNNDFEFTGNAALQDGISLDDISITGTTQREIFVTLEAPLVEGTSGNAGSIAVQVPPRRDLEVKLAADPAAKLTVPASVIIPAGKTAASFWVDAADDGLLQGAQTVWIRAVATGYVTKFQDLLIADDEQAVLAITASKADALEGDTVDFEVTLDRPVAKVLPVSLTASDHLLAPLPASVEIPAGALSTRISIVLGRNAIIEPPRTLVISASQPGWPVASCQVVVSDENPRRLLLELPDYLRENDVAPILIGKVKVDGTMAQDLEVVLTSSQAAVLQVANPVTIPAGKGEVTLSFSPTDDLLVSGTRRVEITASAATFASAQEALDVYDDESPPAPVLSSPALGGEVAAKPLRLEWTLSDPSTRPDLSYEVYFNLNPLMGPEELVGVTADKFWSLPALQPGWTYYWQIVTKLGDVRTPGPIWNFSVPPAGPATALIWDPISSPQSSGAPVSVTLQALDRLGNLATAFNGMADLENAVPLRVGPFANGVWSGTVFPIAEGSTRLRGRIQVAENAIAGDSNEFTTLSTGTLSFVLVNSVNEDAGELNGDLLLNPAMSAPALVEFYSSRPEVIQVPAPILIPVGASRVPLKLQVHNDSALNGPRQVWIYARLASRPIAAKQLLVTDDEIASLAISLPPSSAEGALLPVTVHVSLAPDENLVIGIASTNSFLIAPATIVIPAGATSATVELPVRDDYQINDTPVRLTPVATGWPSTSAEVLVEDDEPRLISLIPAQTAWSENDAGATGEAAPSLKIRTPVPVWQPYTFTLISSLPERLSLPATATIPAGADFVDVPVTIVNNSVADGRDTVAITAEAPTFASKTISMIVMDNEAVRLTLSNVPDKWPSAMPTKVKVAALSVDGDPAASVGKLNFSAAAEVGTVSLTPVDGAVLNNGVWEGDLILSGLAQSVTLRVESDDGLIGTSNVFDVIVPNVQVLPIAASDLAYDALRRELLLVDSEVGLMAVNVDTRAVRTLATRNTPTSLALADDGRTVYVASVMHGEIVKVNLEAWQVQERFVIDPGTGNSARSVGSLAVVPGNPDRVIVVPLVRYPPSDGGADIGRTAYEGAEVYAGSTLLPDKVAADVTMLSLAFGSGVSELWGLGNGKVRRLNLLESGVAASAQPAASLLGSELHWNGGRLGTNSGRFVNAETLVGMTSLPFFGLSKMDLANDRVYGLQRGTAPDPLTIPPTELVPDHLIAFTPDIVETARLPIDSLVSFPHDLRRWGSRGLAYLAEVGIGTRLVIVDDSSLVSTTDLEVLAPRSVFENAGGAATAEVRLPGPGLLDVVLDLSSSNPALVAVPSSVTIPAGQRGVTFSLAITDDSARQGARTVTIQAASAGFHSAQAAVRIDDDDLPALDLVLPVSTANEGAGEIGMGRILLETPLDAALPIYLASSQASVSLPLLVVVEPGASEVTFPLSVADDPYLGNLLVDITAAFSGGNPVSAQLVVMDSDAGTLSANLLNEIVWEGLESQLAIYLSGLPQHDLLVTVTSSVPTLIPSANVVIPANVAGVNLLVLPLDDEESEVNQTVVLTVSAPGLPPVEVQVLVRDDEPAAVAIEEIPDPQTAGTLVTLTGQGTNLDGDPLASDTPIMITMANDDGAVPLDVSEDNLSDGGVLSYILLTKAGTGNVIRVHAGGRLLGETNRFTVLPAEHSGFSFSPPPAHQDVLIPFPVSIRAIDAYGNTVPSFTGPAELIALMPDLREFGINQQPWNYPLNTFYDYARTSCIYTPAEVGPAAKITGLSLNIVTAPGRAMTNFQLRMKHTKLANYSRSADRLFDHYGWTDVFLDSVDIVAPGWVKFDFAQPFYYNGTDNLLLDVSFSIVEHTDSVTGEVASTTMSTPRCLLTSGHQFLFGGGAAIQEDGYVSTYLPDVRFHGPGPALPLVPGSLPTFAQGVWSGLVTVESPAAAAYLMATGEGKAGASEAFTIDSLGTPSLEAPNPVRETDGLIPDALRLSIPGPAEEVIPVTLLHNQPDRIILPSSTSLGSGVQEVLTNMTAVDDPYLEGDQVLRIEAKVPRYGVAVAEVTLRDDEQGVLTLTLPTTVTETPAGQAGSTGQGVLTLDHALVGVTTIALTSSNPAAFSVPAAISIPEGQTAVTFTYTVLDDFKVDGDQPVTITATAPGLAASRTLTVKDNESRTFLLSLSLPSRQEGVGRIANAVTVSLAGTTVADVPVSITSQDETEVQGSTVVIRAGTSSVIAALTIVDDGEVDGTQAVQIRASSPTFNDGVTTLQVQDNELHHFSIDPIATPQVRQAPVTVLVKARTIDDVIVPGFTGNVVLSAESFGTAIPTAPSSSGSFSQGQWTGKISFLAYSDNVILHCADDPGAQARTGQSNPFAITFGTATRFGWTGPTLPARAAQALPVLLAAMDDYGNTVPTFSGTAQLSALADSASDDIVGHGNLAVAKPLDVHLSKHRSQLLFTARELSGPAQWRAISLDVVSLPATPVINLTNLMVRFKPTTLTNYSTAAQWESGGWHVAYKATTDILQTGWVRLEFTAPFNYNGTDNVIVDLSFDGTRRLADTVPQVLCRHTGTNALMAYTFSINGSAQGFPENWVGATPVGVAESSRPNLKFHSAMPLPVQPQSASDFMAGQWVGSIELPIPARNVRLLATSGAMLGFGGYFDLWPSEDSDADGMPDAWESSQGLNTAEAGADGDPDGDGLSNLLEYAVGTSPFAPSASPLSVNLVTESDGHWVELTYVRRIGGAHLIYRLESSTNLTSWQSLASAEMQIMSVVPNPDSTTETVRSRLLPAVAPTAPLKFYRLGIAVP